MKTMRKFFYLSFIIMLMIYVGTNLAFTLIAGKEINMINILTIGVIISIIYSLIYYGGLSVTLKPKFAYLESEELNEPVFGDKCERTIKKDNTTLNFNDVTNKIQEKWKVTYSYRQNNIIKFRSKINFNTWGVGVILKFDNENIKIISFPITGYTKKGNKLAKHMIEMTEKLINK